MTTKEFILIVSEMRAAQRAYFRTRTLDMLEQSKKLEKKVDEALRICQYPGLFVDDEGVQASRYSAALMLVDAVERYARQECLRSELMQTKDTLKTLLK